jgi:hypothetical protein
MRQQLALQVMTLLILLLLPMLTHLLLHVATPPPASGGGDTDAFLERSGESIDGRLINVAFDICCRLLKSSQRDAHHASRDHSPATPVFLGRYVQNHPSTAQSVLTPCILFSPSSSSSRSREPTPSDACSGNGGILQCMLYPDSPSLSPAFSPPSALLGTKSRDLAWPQDHEAAGADLALHEGGDVIQDQRLDDGEAAATAAAAAAAAGGGVGSGGDDDGGGGVAGGDNGGGGVGDDDGGDDGGDDDGGGVVGVGDDEAHVRIYCDDVNDVNYGDVNDGNDGDEFSDDAVLRAFKVCQGLARITLSCSS